MTFSTIMSKKFLKTKQLDDVQNQIEAENEACVNNKTLYRHLKEKRKAESKIKSGRI